MSENLNNEVTEELSNKSIKELADSLKKINVSQESALDKLESNSNEQVGDSTFRVAETNLPEKISVWTKIRNVLFYEIKVELTPYQQKIEDEINEFLHKEITWKSVKNFLFQEVPITYKGKKVF